MLAMEKRADEHKPDSYDFTKTIRGAWNWPTKELAERACRLFSDVGIAVEHPSGTSAHWVVATM